MSQNTSIPKSVAAEAAAKPALPAPVFHDPKHHIKIYQGDCLEILPAIPEATVDLVFADPPYFLSNNGITCHAGRIYQDATTYTSSLAPGQSVTHELAKGRRAYLFLIGGDLDLNGEKLHAGDRGRITDVGKLTLAAPKSSNGAAPADFLLIDLP